MDKIQIFLSTFWRIEGRVKEQKINTIKYGVWMAKYFKRQSPSSGVPLPGVVTGSLRSWTSDPFQPHILVESQIIHVKYVSGRNPKSMSPNLKTYFSYGHLTVDVSLGSPSLQRCRVINSQVAYIATASSLPHCARWLFWPVLLSIQLQESAYMLIIWSWSLLSLKIVMLSAAKW